MDIPLFASTQLTLLSAEADAERTLNTTLLTSLPPASLQRHGLALQNLSLSSTRTGLGGRTILSLTLDPSLTSDPSLPTHGLRSGDIVHIAEQPSGAARKKEKTVLEEKGLEGVVHRVTDTTLTVAVGGGGGRKDAKGDGDAGVEGLYGKRVWAVQRANEVVMRRMVKAMETLREMGERVEGGEGIVRVLFGHQEPGEVESVEVGWLDDGLNESQKEAVRFALGSKDVALIHGPPGTGKTQTLLEIIRQLAKDGKKVLVCGPSNISVDNIVLRLPPDLPIIRLGHPARLLPRVVERSLDVLSQTSDAGEIVKDVRNELDGLLGRLVGGGKNRLKGRERREAWENVKQLRGEFRFRESKATRDIVAGSQVILSTLHGAGTHHIFNTPFDVLIIDEGSQALEAQCWIPLLHKSRPSKLILAGDHLQLPPTVKSTTPPKSLSLPRASNPRFQIPSTLEETLFSRLLTLHGPKIKRLLNTQYRMHSAIMSFPSQHLYNSQLVAHVSVKSRLLCDLPNVASTEDTTVPVLFIDTQGGDFPEAPQEEKSTDSNPLTATSHSNPSEAALTAAHVHRLISAGVPETEIAVITPYNGQLALIVSLLRERYPALELGSIDGFQGREKEAVVVSLVRSNGDRKTGFLKEERRLNVAFTRPRRHLCVVGDAETVKHAGGFLGRWVRWVEGAEEGVEVRYPGLEEVEV
ncbi:P-loop containing nucleoside triphosphate hydrolase protein [Ascodesmis nigricans]|uniref:DNA helicase n=1 Tax=Ascodesmis nigricans TaxID=341454 RepID=A0A4S2MWS4_9PEZI|nr:P-loop containing nucleoside triphosphate hydrolase protein [Ascodesmis nigricans]